MGEMGATRKGAWIGGDQFVAARHGVTLSIVATSGSGCTFE